MERQTAKTAGGTWLPPRQPNQSTALSSQGVPAGGEHTWQTSGPQMNSNHLFTDGPRSFMHHKNIPGRPVGVMDREVNKDLQFLLTYEPRKKQAGRLLGGNVNSNQIQEVTALRQRYSGNPCGASSPTINTYGSVKNQAGQQLSGRVNSNQIQEVTALRQRYSGNPCGASSRMINTYEPGKRRVWRPMGGKANSNQIQEVRTVRWRDSSDPCGASSPMINTYESGKRRVWRPLGEKANSNQIQEVKAVKWRDWSSPCGAPLRMINAQTSQHHWESGRCISQQQLRNIPMAGLDGPMCIRFHGSYPVSIRPTLRDEQRGSLITHPHRVAWLAAKGLYQLRVERPIGKEAEECCWRRNVVEQEKYLRLVEFFLDEAQAERFLPSPFIRQSSERSIRRLT